MLSICDYCICSDCECCRLSNYDVGNYSKAYLSSYGVEFSSNEEVFPRSNSSLSVGLFSVSCYFARFSNILRFYPKNMLFRLEPNIYPRSSEVRD